MEEKLLGPKIYKGKTEIYHHLTVFSGKLSFQLTIAVFPDSYSIILRLPTVEKSSLARLDW